MNLQNLHAPFPPNEIEWRVGSTNRDKSSGLALAYLTARHVMERLDEVCGPENWQDRYEFHGKRTVCYLSIRIGDQWVTKADGAGDSDVEAEKGAISDALKRAAVKWGIGRYLYSLGNTWVDLEEAGRSVRIKKGEFAKLERILRDRFGVPPSDMGNVNEAAVEAAPETAPTAPLLGEIDPDVEAYNALLRPIQSAMSIDDLQTRFERAWKATTDKDVRRSFKAAYDKRKSELDQPAGYTPPSFDTLDRTPADYLRA